MGWITRFCTHFGVASLRSVLTKKMAGGLGLILLTAGPALAVAGAPGDPPWRCLTYAACKAENCFRFPVISLLSIDLFEVQENLFQIVGHADDSLAAMTGRPKLIEEPLDPSQIDLPEGINLILVPAKGAFHVLAYQLYSVRQTGDGDFRVSESSLLLACDDLR